jgi:hypothetical protein
MFRWVRLPGHMSKIHGGKLDYLEVCQEYMEVSQVIWKNDMRRSVNFSLRYVEDMRRKVMVTWR